jgi:hypothetical protein
VRPIPSVMDACEGEMHWLTIDDAACLLWDPIIPWYARSVWNVLYSQPDDNCSACCLGVGGNMVYCCTLSQGITVIPPANSGNLTTVQNKITHHIYPVCSKEDSSAVELQALMTSAFLGPITPPQQQQLINGLQRDPKSGAQSLLSPHKVIPRNHSVLHCCGLPLHWSHSSPLLIVKSVIVVLTYLLSSLWSYFSTSHSPNVRTYILK